MSHAEARTAMISGAAVIHEGRRYIIRSLVELPVSRLTAAAREGLKETTGPTVHLAELININSNYIDYALLEGVENDRKDCL